MRHLLPVRWLALSAVLFAVGCVYFPGLAGGFLLDDWANLKPLERLQAWGFWQGLPSMLASNPAGDLGRPIPLLTFALQYADWPGNPAAFKQVNLAIHLFNVLLVWAWAKLLWNIVRPQAGPRLAMLPLLLALAWGLHPLFISTVLYVVQRMALLAGTFMLAGLLLCTLGRLRWAAGVRHGPLLMAAGLLLGTGLGALCKENALLLPGLVSVLELTLFAGLRRPRGWGAFVLLGCLLPSLALIGFIGLRFESWILPGYAIRDFGPAERLMTEARILWEYLGRLVLPLPWQLGLFHDDYAISRSLLEPWSTLPAAIGVAGLVLCVVIGRRQLPAATFAIGGFLWGHALESGPIPLELYFEHRNYLPSLFVILGGGMGIMAWAAGREKPAKASWPAWRYGLLSLGLWLGYLSFVTLQETRLWGNPDVQAELWAQRRPDSQRANAYLGERLEYQGFVKAAGQLYGRMEARDPAMVLARAKTDCRLGLTYDPERYRESLARVPSMRFSRSGLAGVEQLMLLATEHKLCTDFAAGLIPLAADAMRANPLLGRMHLHLWVLEGRYRLGSGRPTEARAAFGSALALRPDVEVALLAVQADARSGNVDAAQRSLGLARAILAGYNPVRRQAYEKDVAALSAALAAPATETR
ncbi:MAG: hypothetical protein K8F56_04775 [Rhodocyclaceae bacterium]|nr:hypothetical protein [Rhodocyclaceae bacterium]